MNIIEVYKKKNVGKVYEIFTNGKSKGKWKIEEVGKGDFDFFNAEGEPLELNLYYVSEIINLEFEEVVDWSKVPVDTKVLVSNNGKEWHRRHFAKYENDKVYCFNDGYSSFTIVNYAYLSNATPWEYAKLYQE